MSGEDTKQKKEEEQKVDDGLDRKTLFVRSIPFDATSEELSEFFSQFVPVKHAVIVKDGNQQSRGFGFISFTMEDDSLTALVESRKTKFKGRLLRVDLAKRRDRKEKTLENKEKSADSSIEKRRARLIIRNLPWSCKKPEELKKIFSKYGAVYDAYIPKKKGGQMSGFAFVTMKKNVAAEMAVKESVGLKIDGREVAVDLAVEKSKWEKLKEEETVNEANSEDEDGEGSEEEEEEEGDGKEEEGGEKDNKNETNNTSMKDSDDEVSELENFDELNRVNSDDEDEVDDDDDDEDDKPKKKSNRQEPFAIFVRNIPYDADSESLNEHFSRFGPVKYALPVIDKETGLAKGSAFVAFVNEDAYTACLENAPSVASTSLLIADDVSPDYVYQGRILSVSSAVDRESAHKLAERRAKQRKEILGKTPGEKDKRSLFLLNEGRITENSKLAQFISKTDMEMREKSYKLRVQQLNKNPSLHLSITRLAIRNLPRAMNSKALKALGRKAVVQFATEVKEEKRQPLSKEEINRSTHYKHELDETEATNSKKKSKHSGVVKQAKVIMEVKGSGEVGRSRGYGFIEYRDHKSALMGLRWLNAHEVIPSEILEGLTDEEKKSAKIEGLTKRRLIAEFAIENAQVVKRRKEKVFQARMNNNGKTDDKKRKRDEADASDEKETKANKKARKGSNKKGNMNKGAKSKSKALDTEEESRENKNKSGLSDNIKKIIGSKRRKRKSKN